MEVATPLYDALTRQFGLDPVVEVEDVGLGGDGGDRVDGTADDGGDDVDGVEVEKPDID